MERNGVLSKDKNGESTLLQTMQTNKRWRIVKISTHNQPRKQTKQFQMAQQHTKQNQILLPNAFSFNLLVSGEVRSKFKKIIYTTRARGRRLGDDFFV